MNMAVTNQQRMEAMEQRLRAALAPTELGLEDESYLHAGHEGARSGKGHFALDICSTQFAGLPALARHRLVYAALGSMMQDEIHALRINARTP